MLNKNSKNSSYTTYLCIPIYLYSTRAKMLYLFFNNKDEVWNAQFKFYKTPYKNDRKIYYTVSYLKVCLSHNSHSQKLKCWLMRKIVQEHFTGHLFLVFTTSVLVDTVNIRSRLTKMRITDQTLWSRPSRTHFITLICICCSSAWKI